VSGIDSTVLTCLRCTIEQPLGNFKRFDEFGREYLYDYCVVCCEKISVERLYQEGKPEYHTPTIARHMQHRAFALGKSPAIQRKEPKLKVTETPKIDPAHREIARRELMKKSLLAFTKEFHGSYSAGWVHYDIAARLERFVRQVEEKKSPRLMLFMPPRSGKSAIASEKFPPWILGHHPEWEVIHATHTMGLTEEFSGKARDTVASEEFQAVFPDTRIRKDSGSVQRWKTTKGGGYKAAGVGTGISGMGAHVLIIDDPVKDDEAADSETIRQKHIDWYGTTSMTRVSPGGGILVIMTRWHDMDLAGRLLSIEKEMREAGTPEDEYDRWEVISYPAIAEDDEYLEADGSISVGNPRKPRKKLRSKGDALHPARYDLPKLVKIRNQLLRINPRHWNALYQQKPVPDDGEYFQRSQFRYHDMPSDWWRDPHRDLYIVAAWDLAIGQKQTNDWTVGVVGAIDYDDNIYLLDVIRGKKDGKEIVDAVVSVQKTYNPMRTGIERGQLSMALRPMLEDKLKHDRVPINFDETLKPISDKQARARTLQGKLGLGKIWLPKGQPWAEVLVGECLRFPTGEHDDQVDALAWLAIMCANMQPPQRPVSKVEISSWRDNLHEYLGTGGESWMSA
jgi:predicted phage terminase large subunit-like protein